MTRRSAVGMFMAIVVGALLTPSSAMAAVDVFLKLTGVQGESADAQHKNEIDVLSWSWGESTGTGKTKQGNVPQACIQDLALMKRIDAASPQLVMNSVTGVVATEGVLTLRKAGGEQQEFLTLKMTNVSVASYQISGSSEVPTESVLLHFESMHGEYTRVDERGLPRPPIVFDISGRVCN